MENISILTQAFPFQAPSDGVSVLSQITVTGMDGCSSQSPALVVCLLHTKISSRSEIVILVCRGDIPLMPTKH